MNASWGGEGRREKWIYCEENVLLCHISYRTATVKIYKPLVINDRMSKWMNETLGRKENVQHMYNFLNYSVISIFKGLCQLLLCLLSLSVFINTICQTFGGEFSRTDSKPSLKIKYINVPSSRRNRSLFLPHISFPRESWLPKSSTSPLGIFIIQKRLGSIVATLVTIQLTHSIISNCYVQVGTDCHDSLTWVERSACIM